MTCKFNGKISAEFTPPKTWVLEKDLSSGEIDKKKLYDFIKMKAVLVSGTYIDFKIDKELINVLVNYFECSKLEVIQYMDLLSKEQLKNTLTMYGKNKKEIKWL